MLSHQRRKRQEVSSKVGEAPAHLLPPGVGADPAKANSRPLDAPRDGGNGRRFPDPSPAPAYSAPQHHPFSQPTDVHPPLFASGPLPPPIFDGPHDGLGGGVGLGLGAGSPSCFSPTQGGGAVGLGSYNGDAYAPPREIRSAGHVQQFGPPPVVQPSPRGSVSEAPQYQSGSPPRGAKDAEPPMPMYGRRARTTDVNGRDVAREQRQLEYQREIEAQIAEARQRKQMERAKIKKEEDELERRVQEDRARLANKERQEREKEVKDREDKEAAQFGKRRGGNHKPATPDTSEHQKELQRQIEEKRRRKDDEEETKRRADEQYDRRYGGAQGAAVTKPVDHSVPFVPQQAQHVPPMTNAINDGAPLPSSTAALAPTNQFQPLQQPPWGSQQQPLWSEQQQPHWQQPQQDPTSGLSKMKDEIFSMLVDQHRQQQQMFFPQPTGPSFSLASPSYASAQPYAGHFSGGAPQPPSGSYGGSVPSSNNAPLHYGGMFNLAGGAQDLFGRPPQPYQAPQPYPPRRSSVAPEMFGNPSNSPAYFGQQQQHQLPQHQGTQDVLRRFLDEDRSEAAGLGFAQDDISMELPTEQVKLVGRPRDRRF